MAEPNHPATDDEYVYAVPGDNHIIDAIGADGLTWVNRHTLDQVLARYPDAERYTWDQWLAVKAARLRGIR